MRNALASILTAFVLSGAVTAQTETDEGFWFMFLATGGFGDTEEEPSKLRWWLDVQPRFSNASGGMGQFLLRPGLGYATSETTTAWLGYAWIETERSVASSSFFTEHRIWQQFLWKPKIEGFRFMSRTRLEQRFVETGSDVGWRFRQFVKGAWPLPFEERLALTAYDEVFFHLNDTDWGATKGFDQNRLFVGLGWKFDTGVLGEIGYLNQYVGRTGPDRMNHILSINLILSF